MAHPEWVSQRKEDSQSRAAPGIPQETDIGFRQEYSANSHATFQVLMLIALFLAPEDLPHEDRDKVDQTAEVMLATHIARVAAILPCMLTEVQASCRA